MSKVYRIVTDEPIGITVGFLPKGADSDSFELIHDDGGEFVKISKDGLSIVSDVNLATEPDLMIWRNIKEYNEWLEEMEE